MIRVVVVAAVAPAALAPGVVLLVVLTVLALALVAVRRLQVRRGMSLQTSRKAAHVTTSLVALSLPWLFDDPWPVLVLAGLAVLSMLAVRLVPAFRGVGGVLWGTEPQSVGDVAFPVAVALLFVLTADSPVLYVIPLLLLGLAAPAAALVGARHGLSPFATDRGTKSREESVAFAFVAFLCVHVPLLVFTPIGRAESLWVAAVIALLATLVEAVSWGGLDNLFVPVGTYAVLMRLMTFDATLLAGHFATLLLLIGVAALLRRETTVGGAGVFGAALVGYVVWALGGTAWLLPPVMVYLLYARVWPAAAEADGLPHDAERRPHTAHNVFSVSSVGVLWLITSSALGAELLVPYAIAWGAYLTFLGVDRMRVARPYWSVGQLAWRAAWRATLIAVCPVLVVVWLRVWADLASGVPGTTPSPDRPVLLTAVIVASALVATWISAAILARWKRVIDEESTEFEGRVYRAGIVVPVSALGLIALLV